LKKLFSRSYGFLLVRIISLATIIGILSQSRQLESLKHYPSKPHYREMPSTIATIAANIIRTRLGRGERWADSAFGWEDIRHNCKTSLSSIGGFSGIDGASLLQAFWDDRKALSGVCGDYLSEWGTLVFLVAQNALFLVQPGYVARLA
jgi:hypothetical protein